MNKHTFPILLTNPKILIIGGGNVALQKAIALKNNNINFKIISKKITKDLKKLISKRKKKKFKLKDIKNHNIIIDATGDEKVAKKLLKYKKKHNILLNIVNNPKKCDFYFMALTKNRPLQIAVSSNGASPTVAKIFRDRCEKLIPDDLSKYLKQKHKQRKKGIINIKKTKKDFD